MVTPTYKSTEQLNLIRGPTGGVGLGISRAERSGPFVVRQLVPGGSVEQSKRVQVGDQLHEVGGVSVHDKSLDEVKVLILGQPGTALSLKYYSPTPDERAQIMANVNGEANRMSVAPETRMSPAPQRVVLASAPPDRNLRMSPEPERTGPAPVSPSAPVVAPAEQQQKAEQPLMLLDLTRGPTGGVGLGLAKYVLFRASCVSGWMSKCASFTPCACVSCWLLVLL